MKEFIGDHYLFIMIIAAFLVFALIGYIIDSTRNKKKAEAVEGLKENNVLLTENIVPEVQPEEVENVTNESQPEISEVEDDRESSTKNEEDFVLTDDQKDLTPEVLIEKIKHCLSNINLYELKNKEDFKFLKGNSAGLIVDEILKFSKK